VSAFNRQALDPARGAAVSACAGSGKTWLLVSRIIRLLLAGAEPSEILAITFTRKAAQEMAERLSRWLRDMAMADDDRLRAFLREREVHADQVDALLTPARELFERVLTADTPLAIQTFHGWFLQLLRNAPLEAGTLGAVTLIDRTSALLNEAWERLMLHCQREHDSPAAAGVRFLFRRYGLNNTRALLGGFVGRRAEWWAYAGMDAMQAQARALERLAAEMTVDPQFDVIADLCGEKAFIESLRELTKLLLHNGARGRTFVEAVARALAGGTNDTLFAAIRELLFTSSGDARKISASKALVTHAGAHIEPRLRTLHDHVMTRVCAAMQALVDQTCYRVNASALAAGGQLLEIFQDIKRERQVIDFADIEWLGGQLLAHGEHALTMQFKLDSRYRHILLDEFQDTNPLQWLALQAWIEAAREADSAPTLFVVGDPKQSIYRFRRADPALFNQACAYVDSQGGYVLTQNESRRCASVILNVVNSVFSAQPLCADFARHEAYFSSLPGRVEILGLAYAEPSAAQADGSASGALLRNPFAQPRVDAEDRRRATEATRFAARLLDIVANWRVIDDPHRMQARPATFADVIVLVRRRTHLAVYERALRSAKIPYLSSRQGGLLDTLEAEDLAALLEFLVCPSDDLKLAQTLRSPIFSCTDEDLMTLAALPGGAWWERLQAHIATSQASVSLQRAARLLSQWRARADAQPVHDQLDRIYFEADLLRRYQASVPESARPAVAANLQALIEQALNTDAGRYPSLPRFIAELRELRAAPAEEAPDEGVLGDFGNAVRIMTVHGAKGLEAPIVWLLDTAAVRARERSYDALVDWPPGAHEPRHFSLATVTKERSGAQRELFGREESAAAREDLNLLYVAMTRARQALLVSACATRAPPESWYARIRHAVHTLDQAQASTDNQDIAYGANLAASGDDAGGRMNPTTGNPSAAEEALNRPIPTGARFDVGFGAGFDYGSAFHRLMEHLLKSADEPPEALRRRLQLPADGFAAMWAQARRLVAQPGLARYFDPAQYLRAANELSIITEAGDVRRIDRVVEFADEVTVLDYKTGSFAAIAGTALEARYRAQLLEYCSALQHVYAGKRVRGELLFADGSRTEV
jgi:ATP-dependent helicase/nuclease subunit A